MSSKKLLATTLIIGGVVGGGMFSLPYALLSVGLGWGTLYLVAVCSLMIITYHLYSDVLLKTPGQHNYVSLTKFYLGNFAEFLSILFTVVTVIFVLFIYLNLAERFLNLLWPVSGLIPIFIFWLLASISIFFGLKKLAEIEFLSSIAIAGIVFVSFLFSLPALSLEKFLTFFNQPFQRSLFWLPIGPLLFAFSGRAAVSELLIFSHKDVKKIIGKAFFLIAVIYLIFVLGVLFLTNGMVSEDTISGLASRLPLFLIVLVGVLGLIALWHIYVFLGFDVNNILVVDLGWPKFSAGLLVVAAPLILYLLSWQNFFTAVSFAGGVFAALENIFIVLMWLKMKKGRFPLPLVFLVLAVFVIVFLHELWVQFLPLV